ncbi:hypothetical protein SIN01_11310 [Sporolactobacillus inulinus]|nr:hypothetical protein SIN01_11310 [Sporolactobacillus inulinus]
MLISTGLLWSAINRDVPQAPERLRDNFLYFFTCDKNPEGMPSGFSMRFNSVRAALLGRNPKRISLQSL